MRRPLASHLPQLIFLAALLLGVAMTLTVYMAESRSARLEFERVADLTVDRVITRLRQHVAVLRAARGLFAARDGAVSRAEFQGFLDSVDLAHEFPGAQGVGFARMIAAGEEAAAEDEIARHYGRRVKVRPPAAAARQTPIVLLEPADERNLHALGYDMYSEPARRAAMDAAVARGGAQISAPVELVQETGEDRQAGFLIYLPYVTPGAEGGAEGFVYAPFRGRDLIEAALAAGPPLPVAFSITDTAAPERPIFDGRADAPSGMTLSRTVEVLGRTWAFELHAAGIGGWLNRHLGSLLVAVTSALFAVTAGLAISARRDEVARARHAADAAVHEAEYRRLLLQEMKHRIKNHITRIQSIARQSARGAEDVRAFTEAFEARLQAMAEVQDILAGNAMPETDIRTILRKELRQCLDTAEVEHLLDGPPVRLDERQSHAFALVAHELVTNAMKFGGLSDGGRGLRVAWSVEPAQDGDLPEVRIDWAERTAAEVAPSPDTRLSGFGSRLIDASVRGELAGTIRRDFRPGGLAVELRFPVSAAVAADAGAEGEAEPSRRQA